MAGSTPTRMGAVAAPTAPAPQQSTYAPMASPSAPNVYQQSASALSRAQDAATGLSNFSAGNMRAAQLGAADRMQGVGAAQAPGQIAVNQLASTDLSQYMNPYTQNVIETGQADIERQRQMASNTLGAQAQAAGAFGGSRQAVQEGVLAGEALRQAGALSAQQRGQAFQSALQSGQFDIGQTQQARALASGQQMQAREAAAAREQAARAGNMAAANQFAVQQAQLEQAANQANYQGQFQEAAVRAGAANQLGNLSQTGFGFGQQIGQQQAQQGLMQQGLQQALIDAARGQYQGFTGAPQQSLSLPLAALGAQPNQSTTTQSRNPGLFDYLSLGATAAASDSRLKTNVRPLDKVGDVSFYSWDWNDEGKKVAHPTQPTFGVIADELQETHPHLVERGEDGYLRVNYKGLMSELEAA